MARKNDRAKKGNLASLSIAIALLLGSAGLATGGIWFSIQLFINPNAVIWVNQFLPKWAKFATVKPEFAQTLTQIQASIKQQGKISGNLLSLDTQANPLQLSAFLLPVLERQPNCQNNCEQIVELRLYQRASIRQPSNETYYQLVEQVLIEGLDETLAIAPLVEVGIADYAFDRSLPLTQLHQFTAKTPPGIWLYLLGEKLQGNNAIAYGQIVYYDPKTSDLSLILPWTSPLGKAPRWQQVTGNNSPELVIDETVDLEPRFKVYQVKTIRPNSNFIQLEEISLLTPALNLPAYRDAILLARNGLWSPAWKWLQLIEQQQRKSWSASAQAQMDLIHLYAQFTQNQAAQTWVSPSQQVLTYLIDGRWQQAFQVFQASCENTQEVAAMLKADRGQVWNRVEAALQVNPDSPEVLAWGVLVLTAQSGRERAIAWLKQQTKNSQPTFEYIDNLPKRI